MLDVFDLQSENTSINFKEIYTYFLFLDVMEVHT